VDWNMTMCDQTGKTFHTSSALHWRMNWDTIKQNVVTRLFWTLLGIINIDYDESALYVL